MSATVGAQTSVYAYDAGNRRVQKQVGATPATDYVWEGGQVLAEYDRNTSTWTDYVWAGGKMVATVRGATTTFYFQDRLSTRLSTDSNGTVVGAQSHFPFGEDAGSTGTNEKHRFTNYEHDSESSSENAVIRQYSASVARFYLPDPVTLITNPQGINRYSYCRNDPIGHTDPYGLFTTDDGFDVELYGYAEAPENSLPGQGPLTSSGGFGSQVQPNRPQGSNDSSANEAKVPCPIQDFAVDFEFGGFSPAEINAVIQTAVGEASSKVFDAREVQAVIATIFNRLAYNWEYASAGVGKLRAYKGGDSVIGILGSGYEAHNRQSGAAKLAGARQQGSGVILEGTIACSQLKEATSFVFSAITLMPSGQLLDQYPLTGNLAVGAGPLPKGVTAYTTYGETRFFFYPLPPQ